MVTSTHPHPAVGAQLREAYDRLGLTITQLEKLSGVSRKYISLAFEGANISLSILEKLSRALKISAIKLGGLDIDAGEPALSNADLAVATSLLERGLRDAMDGVGILRRHDVRDDPISIARQVTSGIRKRKSSGERAAADDAELNAETSSHAVRASARRRR
jgi:transcriptional regulator with XRE-family HTH domain